MIFLSRRRPCSQITLIRVSLQGVRQRRSPTRWHGRTFASTLFSWSQAEVRGYQSFSHVCPCKSRIFKRGTFKPAFNMRPGNGREGETSLAIPCRCQPRRQLICKYSWDPSFSPYNNQETQNLKPVLQKRLAAKGILIECC